MAAGRMRWTAGVYLADGNCSADCCFLAFVPSVDFDIYTN